jgi:hypothetical protein
MKNRPPTYIVGQYSSIKSPTHMKIANIRAEERAPLIHPQAEF